MKKNFVIVVVLSILFFGCAKKTTNDIINATTGIGAIEKKIQAESDIAKAQCVELCRAALQNETDLASGPCLGNPIPNMNNWVCDVVHNPRIDADNQKENQCAYFTEGNAKHFIEVDENCRVINSL